VLARARVVVECDGSGRSVVRELRSKAALTLLPQRGATAARSPVATVHLVGSATTPLGGDDVGLDVEVGPGADLVLTGVAAALALPGQGRAGSRLVVRLQVGECARVRYLPEPTIVTRRAEHHSELYADLAPGARLRCREVLVAGRNGEASGRYHGLTRVRDAATGRPLLVQSQELGDPDLHASAAHLAGRRVLGTEVLVWGREPGRGRGRAVVVAHTAGATRLARHGRRPRRGDDHPRPRNGRRGTPGVVPGGVGGGGQARPGCSDVTSLRLNRSNVTSLRSGAGARAGQAAGRWWYLSTYSWCDSRAIASITSSVTARRIALELSRPSYREKSSGVP
jgi:urease accessory protein